MELCIVGVRLYGRRFIIFNGGKLVFGEGGEFVDHILREGGFMAECDKIIIGDCVELRWAQTERGEALQLGVGNLDNRYSGVGEVVKVRGVVYG